MAAPKCILLISGKRKCGKDFISEIIKKTLGDQCCIIRISEPIKSYYAEKNKLDLKELMSDGPYKELHRVEMIKWSDSVRKESPGYFCEAACKAAPIKPIWIVSDVRRKTDISWFGDTYGDLIKTIRISSNDDVRSQRGWVFTTGVDDVTSECDLDDYSNWNFLIDNTIGENYQNHLRQIFEMLEGKLN